ncbi:DUF3164 family protein [Seonamhaeicola sp. NFXS20]|uniref:DUF3164 family protein n=1 Tax=Seonamhaeicola sp. NFXS20 TaxID=2816959 RepID=UPI003B8AAE2F
MCKNIEVIEPELITSNTKSFMKTIQTAKDKIWEDESGMQIPYNRITKTERLIERSVAKIFKAWTTEASRLKELKKMVAELCEQCYQADMKSKGVDPSDKKGNYTMYCFNRNIKVERSVHGNPTYDEATIEAAKIKFDQYMEENVTSKEDFTKDMINEAFESKNKQLDKAKINKLISYKNRSKIKLFQDACDLLSTAARYSSSSIYYRVWKKDENGKYQNIDIQFSSL